jgi:hypothetical protein
MLELKELETATTNKIEILRKIKGTINSGNACRKAAIISSLYSSICETYLPVELMLNEVHSSLNSIVLQYLLQLTVY